jgi:hypothetical protein
MKTINLRSWISILIMVLLLSSCSPGQFLGPTVTPTVTSTSTPKPTYTPTFTSTPSCAYYPDLPCHNGSYYELGYANPAINWDKAAALASTEVIDVCESAHLATVTTAEEQAVIDNLMKSVNEGGWLGGFQPNDELSLAEGWEWITDEAFEYTNWAPTNPCSSSSEPNDCPNGTYIPGSEQSLEIFPETGFWNDAPREELKSYYVIEYENCY